MLDTMTHSRKMPAPSRRWLLGAIASLAADPALAAGCRAAAPTADVRAACLDIARFRRETEAGRRDPAAAWVACIAVVFASYGHPVAPSRIAQDAYGGAATVPPRGGYATVARPLDRMWTDDGGTMFRIACEALYDGSSGGARFDPMPLMQTLAAGDPVVLWTGERPVVLTALELGRVGGGWAVRNGEVLDPMPGAGARPASAAEKDLASAGSSPAFAMRVTFPGLG